MPALQAATFSMDLKPAKPNGLGDLGVPMHDSTSVKKGRLGEAMQMLQDERIGRRFQNLRATLVKAMEGGEQAAKLMLSFEVFGDDNAPLGTPSTVAARLLSGAELLAELPLGSPFMPYASCWYENQFAANVPLAHFDRADRLELITLQDEVRLISA